MKPEVPADAKVYITHLRYYEGAGSQLATRHQAERDPESFGRVKPKGGITLAQIEFADGSTVRGSASCNPRDTYNKAVGRMIAVGRAMKTAQRVGAV